jgi:hypothetical protein
VRGLRPLLAGRQLATQASPNAVLLGLALPPAQRIRFPAMTSPGPRYDAAAAQRAWIDAAKRRLALLQRLEWAGTGYGRGPCCLVCTGQPDDGGHRPGCELAAELR